MNVDTAVKKESLFILYGTLALSALMEAVFLFTGNWSWYVLIANVIGALVSVLNFFFMGISIQHSLNDEADDAKKRVKLSQQIRNLVVFVVICAAASLTIYDVIPENEVSGYIIALVLPLLFNRIIIAVRAKIVLK